MPTALIAVPYGLPFAQSSYEIRVYRSVYGSDLVAPGATVFELQQPRKFAVADLKVSPKWEFDNGIGAGTIGARDHLSAKTVVAAGLRLNARVASDRVASDRFASE